MLGTGLAAFRGAHRSDQRHDLWRDGEAITLKTFAVIVMGGMGNVRGTLLAGWVLGSPRVSSPFRRAAVQGCRRFRHPDRHADGQATGFFSLKSVLGGARDDQRSSSYPQPKRPAVGRPELALAGRADPRRPVRRSLLSRYYYLHAIIISMIFLLPAHGLNLIVGYTGMLSSPGRLLRHRRLCLGLEWPCISDALLRQFMLGCRDGCIALRSRSGLRLRNLLLLMCTLDSS